jgi:hypothetical protein
LVVVQKFILMLLVQPERKYALFQAKSEEFGYLQYLLASYSLRL